MDCIFCKIVKGEIPSYKIYEDDIVYAFLDLNQDCPGHILIIPKSHTLDINSIDDNTLSHVFSVAKKLCNLVTDKMNCQGYSLMQNNGICQEVKHFHLHILPKYKGKPNYTIEEIFNILTK